MNQNIEKLINIDKISLVRNCQSKNSLINELEFFSLEKEKTWVNDEFILNCTKCDKKFTLFNRKHHCRNCGKVFCNICTPYRINIRSEKTQVERVCVFCYHTIQNRKKFKNLYSIIGNLPLDIKDMLVISLVCKKWYKAYHYYYLIIQNLHKEPYSKTNFSNIEWNIIWNNRYLYSGHTCWLIHFVKYVELFKNVKDSQIKEVLYNPRKNYCKNLYCLENCKNSINFMDALVYLELNLKNSIIENYVLETLWTAELSEYQCFIHVLVNMIRPHKTNLLDYLISIASHNYEISNSFFWELSFRISNKNNVNYEFYDEIRKKFINSISEETKLHLKNTFYFVSNLEENIDSEEFGCLLKSYIETFKINNSGKCISSPLNTDKLIHDIDINNIKIKGSFLKPIMIPFILEDKSTYEVMLKKDDLRKDKIVINFIRVMDTILKRELELDLNIITYNVLPINSKFGFIEIVSGAETIYSINKKHNFSILNYILEKNQNHSIDKVKTIFTKSCVAYCLISYILGIGDRHLENIMIKDTGEIFHIDFGFIMGYDPKLITPEIRLTCEMVDAMGGKNSKYYNLFKDLCTSSFLCLRKYINLFKLILSGLSDQDIPIDNKLTREYIDNFLDNKFLIGEDVREVNLYLTKKIISGSHKYSDSIIDFCHNTSVQSSSSVSQNVIQYGTNVLKYFTPF